MGRRIQGAPSGVVRIHTPDVAENLGSYETNADGIAVFVPNEEPVRVFILEPTERERREYYAMVPHKIHRDEEGNVRLGEDGLPVVTLNMRDPEWKKSILKQHCTKIVNYERPATDEEIINQGFEVDQWVAIANGEELWEHGETEFVENIASEILSAYHMREAQKKTSESSSDSTQAETPASPGTVETAELKDSTSSGNAGEEPGKEAGPLPM